MTRGGGSLSGKSLLTDTAYYTIAVAPVVCRVGESTRALRISKSRAS
jgi:hypothetical protein